MVARRLVLTMFVAMAGVAHADVTAPPPPPLVGANELMKLTAPSGFVDDVVTAEGQRLAYVIADTSTKAELHVVQLGCTKCAEEKKEIVVDLAPVTLRPTALKLVGTGRVFVVGAIEDGNQVAGLLDFAKKAPVYKVGPAAHVSLVTRDGATRVAVHKISTAKSGNVVHTVDLLALETGKRVAAGRPFELAGDTNKKLDFHVNHWADSFTRVIGLKGGDWNKKEDQRSPDTEATYDLVAGKLVENKPIADLFEQRKRFAVLADANGTLDFLRMTPDNTSIQLWKNGAMKSVELDQPLSTYDPKSLQGVINADGSAWIALKVDPVNAEAVARKKADPEYLDVFKVGTDGKATRKARVLAKGVRYRFGVIGDLFWLLERSSGFDRGGRSLTVYSL